MSVETVFLLEDVPALLALEGLFPAVRQSVALECARRSNQLTAFVSLVSLVALVAVMRHFVSLESTFLSKAIPAHLAFIGLFPAVRHLVPLEHKRIPEELSTFLACVTLGRECHDEPEK